MIRLPDFCKSLVLKLNSMTVSGANKQTI